MDHHTPRRDETIEGSSPRSFGFVFALVFLIVALWPLMSRGPVRSWALVVALIFALMAVLWPAVLAPFNRWWMRLGLLLGRIVSPISLGIMFFAVFTPLGLMFRALGNDPLRLKRPPASQPTHWVTRTPPGPSPESLKNQF